MVDEISVAVVRCDLAARVQLAFRAIDDEAGETRLRRAAQAAYIVNAFVETFDCAPAQRNSGRATPRGRIPSTTKGRPRPFDRVFGWHEHSGGWQANPHLV